MNIYAKLIILCTSLVFFTAATITYFVNQAAEQSIREKIVHELSQQSVHGINSIERFIHQRMSDIRTIAQLPELRNQSLSSEALMLRLQELQALNPLYYSFSFFTMDRIRVADSKRFSLGEKHSYSKYWTQITPQSTVVMDISLSESVGKVVMHFAAVVRDQEEKAVGLVVSRVLITQLYEVFDLYNIAENQSNKQTLAVDLVDRYGTLLYSNHNPQGVLKEKYDNYPLLEKLQSQAVNTYESPHNLYFYALEPGYLNFPGNGWALILRMPKEIAFQPSYQLRVTVMLLSIPALIVAVILSLVMARLFVRPILKLSKAAQEIEAGNLMVPIPVEGDDEIGQLAKQLHNTTQTLVQRIELQEHLTAALDDFTIELQNRYRKIETQKEEIEGQKEQISRKNQELSQAYHKIKYNNRQITASLNYAKRIQESMLPDLKDLQIAFQEAFVFYLPKAIVSGDFYWFDKVHKNGQDYFVLAAADCTGHGVPGAIMSMLGSNLLSHIVSNQYITDPAEVLCRLDKEIKAELHQEIKMGNSQDGLEIALLVINLENHLVQFGGGGRPLFLFRDDKLIEIKGNKLMVGGVNRFLENRYERIHIDNHTLQLRPDDRIYLFSDGYADQFGGSKNRKFLIKRFRDLLKEIHLLPMAEQEKIIREEYFTWKGDQTQTDDVMVMGLAF